MNEFDFIERLRQQANSRKHSTRILTGIGDDAAVISESGKCDLIVTTDLLIEGVDFHFNATPARLIGHKALAVSLSDVAAMGARPAWSFLSFGMPRERWDSNFKDEFVAGYLALANDFGVTLAGGDVSESPTGIVIDSIVLGEVESGAAVKRSGARAGDQIYVTGNLGGAAAGLKLIEMGARVDQRSEVRGQRSADDRTGSVSVPGAVRGPLASISRGVQDATGSSGPLDASGGPTSATSQSSDDDAIQSLLLRQLRPNPRVGWGIVLGEQRLATSMIDISDGLSSDLHHLCGESKVGALIDAANIPLNQDVKTLCGRRALDPLALALHGGEDFELLFTVAPENISRLPKKVDGVPISLLGEINNMAGSIRVRERDRLWDLPPEGFSHFED
jgi:thiamine-monophosphate kinase